MSDTEQNWFKPKRHGYGATPSNWKGWLATFGFAGVIAVVSIAWVQALTDETRLIGMLAWALTLVAAVWFFCRFARKKTDGPWAWRWNGQLYREMFKPGSDDR